MARKHFLDPAALREQLDTAPESVVVVDCRFNLLAPHKGFLAYLGGHIPGARYAHLDKDLAALPGPADGRHPLPDRGDFCAWLGAIGVAAETRVVAYDDQGGAIAARLWWLLGEVGHTDRWLLDGGLVAWQEAGYPLTDRLPDIVPGSTYVAGASVNATSLAAADIPGFLAAGGMLLDARAGPRFAGRSEPIDPVAGHVPGAVNLPVGDVLDPSGHVLSEPALTRLLAPVIGERRDDAVAIMCGSGVTACMLAAVLDSAGFGTARLYPGSWSEWIRDPERPVATGDRA